MDLSCRWSYIGEAPRFSVVNLEALDQRGFDDARMFLEIHLRRLLQLFEGFLAGFASAHRAYLQAFGDKRPTAGFGIDDCVKNLYG